MSRFHWVLRCAWSPGERSRLIAVGLEGEVQQWPWQFTPCLLSKGWFARDDPDYVEQLSRLLFDAQSLRGFGHL
jgi:hypothetical protein